MPRAVVVVDGGASAPECGGRLGVGPTRCCPPLPGTGVLVHALPPPGTAFSRCAWLGVVMWPPYVVVPRDGDHGVLACGGRLFSALLAEEPDCVRRRLYRCRGHLDVRHTACACSNRSQHTIAQQCGAQQHAHARTRTCVCRVVSIGVGTSTPVPVPLSGLGGVTRPVLWPISLRANWASNAPSTGSISLGPAPGL